MKVYFCDICGQRMSNEVTERFRVQVQVARADSKKVAANRVVLTHAHEVCAMTYIEGMVKHGAA